MEDPAAANERQRDAGLEQRFPDWRPSLFCLLRLVYEVCLKGRAQANITPVPADVCEAVEEELAEEWMTRLAEFVQERLEPVEKPRDATTAAAIRAAFAEWCPDVPKKEVGLRLARRGFAEHSATFFAGVTKTSRRVYQLCWDGQVQAVRLKPER